MKTPTKSLLSVFGSLLVFVIVAFSIAINSFKDGKFTEITLSLSFTETRTLFKQDIIEGGY